MSADNKENEVKVVKGYKVFNPDWTCKGFKYEVGKSYEMDDDIECCSRGFYFCTKLKDCFYYRGFDPDNKVVEVEAYGKIDYSKANTIVCTNRIRIIREIPWNEVLSMLNTGNSNTGIDNKGDNNTGFRNVGDCNTGYSNIGDCNTGIGSVGSYNTGIGNTGDYNTGSNNTGNFNTGDYNATNHSNGYFCTEEPKVTLFNKPTDMTYKEWKSTEAYRLLRVMPDCCAVGESVVVDTIVIHKERQRWYNDLSDKDKNILKSIPNFDADIFKQCTGIDVNKDE